MSIKPWERFWRYEREYRCWELCYDLIELYGGTGNGRYGRLNKCTIELGTYDDEWALGVRYGLRFWVEVIHFCFHNMDYCYI